MKKLETSKILNGEVVEEANSAGEYADEEAESPLKYHVADDVSSTSSPPILLEEVVLHYLVVEAFYGTEIGADDGDLGSTIGGVSPEIYRVVNK